ncbi:ribosome assembly protein 3 [[Candida] anglica]|uniref:Ribosome assembly protein 3 n=1 Tax=[Candida] anglica TaxID=148631 RepID=A0ABP0EEI2_9ASCO
MGAAQVRNETIDSKSKNNRRRRKKRRTEDFSSDSESSSSSSSSEDSQDEDEAKEEEKAITHPVQKKVAKIDIDDVDMLSEEEEDGKSGVIPQTLSEETHEKISNIKLTTTALSNSTGFGKGSTVNGSKVKETLIKDRAQLNNEYLMLMASNFGNDLDELRKKPDFSEKSLVILAKALQSGSNMFDDDTLNAILSK